MLPYAAAGGRVSEAAASATDAFQDWGRHRLSRYPACGRRARSSFFAVIQEQPRRLARTDQLSLLQRQQQLLRPVQPHIVACRLRDRFGLLVQRRALKCHLMDGSKALDTLTDVLLREQAQSIRQPLPRDAWATAIAIHR